MVGTLIEKDGRWLEASANPTIEVARSTAEEIQGKVDRHGVRPLYRNRMMVRTEAPSWAWLQECELMVYRGRHVLSSSLWTRACFVLFASVFLQECRYAYKSGIFPSCRPALPTL